MPAGPGAGDAEGRCRRVAQTAGGGSGLAEPAQSLDEVGRPLGEVGDGAVLDLAVPAERFAQQDAGRRVAIGEYHDRGNGSGSGCRESRQNSSLRHFLLRHPSS